MPDDGHAIHYTAVERGTPVYGADGTQVGKVDTIVDNYREHIFDGVVVEIPGGELKFVDAPEVARTAEHGVTLTIDAASLADHEPPGMAAPSYRPNRGGKVARLLGGGWRKS